MNKVIALFLAVATSSVLAAEGDTFIQNSNQDKDIHLRVNKGGVPTNSVTVKGDTGKLLVTDGFDATGGAGLATSTDPGLISEEDSGACTFSLAFSGGNGTGIIDLQTCRYAKSGKIVLVDYSISIAKGTASGTLRFTMSPSFPPLTNSGYFFVRTGAVTVAASNMVIMNLTSSSPNFRPQLYNPTTGAGGNITDSIMGASTSFEGTLVYYAD